MTDRAGIAWLDGLDPAAAHAALLACCGSTAWAHRMVEHRPFESVPKLLATGDAIWRELAPGDWLEAFAAHPRIGDADGGRQSELAASWSAQEQADAHHAPPLLLARLAGANERYEERFGYTFIICAEGRTPAEMLVVLQARLTNSPEHELSVAADEQRQITRLRLGRLIAAKKVP